MTTALVHLIELGYVRRQGRTFFLTGDAGAVDELERRSPSHEFGLRETTGVGIAAPPT